MNSILHKVTIILIFLSAVDFSIAAQGYLHADGINIVDQAGESVILRGIGTGNWMIMEGYMMNTSGKAGTQHAIRSGLNRLIGVEKTDSFFNVWLNNHFTRTDVDSMKVWGFNSVRVAMHYKWFTPPIEDEPVVGEITWLDKGFVMIDSLLDWCADNEMYLILDMHGTPGGQGKNADISDYDPSKPSLWESEANKTKLAALWYQLAKRYVNEPWIGGYDLINETNWDFENSGNENGINCVLNIPLLELHKRLIDTIRTIDTNHLVYVSGNSWGNNYNGMNSLASYDDNLAYTFHKYWSGNDANSLNWILSKRNALNVPLWMSESGENSNTWFTEAIELFEKNNIGWSWWPVKKSGINNVLKVTENSDYASLIDNWNGSPNEDLAFRAVMKWAENHKIVNCEVKYDVIDAMMRQPHTDEIRPFKEHTLAAPIFFSDFDLGKNGIAYSDKYVANYGGEYVAWNKGWAYRNDGVDIEACQDNGGTTNGYNVGWTEDGEWMQYSLHSDSIAVYQLTIRHASGSSGSKFHIEANGVNVTGDLSLPATGGWQNWRTATFQNVIIPAGDIRIKFFIDKAGSNLNYFNLSNPKGINLIDFELVSCETSTDGQEVLIDLNKEISTVAADLILSDFSLIVDGNPKIISAISKSPSSNQTLVLTMEETLYSDNVIKLSYSGTSVNTGSQSLNLFVDKLVNKRMTPSLSIPGRIQAEDFEINKGLVLETCTDAGGGQNTGYSNAGDYLVFKVHVKKQGFYTLNYRVATEKSNAEIMFQIGDGTSFTSLNTFQFKTTSGWQKWLTQTTGVELDEGYYFIRLYVKNGEHNLNWFELDFSSGVKNVSGLNAFGLYPNPAKEKFSIDLRQARSKENSVSVYNVNGKSLANIHTTDPFLVIDSEGYKSGLYVVKISSDKEQAMLKLIIQ